MDQRLNLSNKCIDALVKNAKHVQNKMRADLLLLSNEKDDKLCPIGGKIIFNLHENCEIKTRNFDVKKNVIKSEKHDGMMAKGSGRTAGKRIECQSKGSTRDLGNQNDLVLKAAVETSSSKAVNTVLSQKKWSHIHNSCSKLEIGDIRYKLTPSISTQRLPLQRFAEKFTGDIDFSKEHPNLEIDTSANPTTLFPRRSQKRHELNNVTSSQIESINLASAKAMSIDARANMKRDTWKDVLEKNRKQKKLRKVDLVKDCPEIALSDKEVAPEADVKVSNNLDVILTPSSRLFYLENQSERTAKQNNFHFQHLPVMYIKPECRIQQVVNISIQRDQNVNYANTAEDFISVNTKYVECTHEDGKFAIDSHPTEVAPEESNTVEAPQITPTKVNRFFKAWDFTELPKCSSTNTKLSQSSSKSNSKSNTTSCSFSSAVLKSQHTISNHSETSNPGVDNIIEDILSSTMESRDQIVRDIPKRKEMCVQTDPEQTIAASLFLPTNCTRVENAVDVSCQTTEQEEELQIEDDLITNIFERIHNDIPSALQAFKTRSNSTFEVVLSESLAPKQNSEESRKSQKLSVSSTSNEKLCPKRNTHRTAADDSPTKIQSNIAANVEDEFSLPQQRKSIVKGEKSMPMKSFSTLHNATHCSETAKVNGDKYPNDAYIKRAVKILLDSLTLGEADVRTEELSIIEDTCIKRIGSTSSEVPDSNSRKGINHFALSNSPKWSSSSLGSLSESDEITEDSTAADMTPNSLSDGEVRSIGEV